MSDLMPSADVVDCPPSLASTPVLESHPPREAALPGGLTVRRALPRAARRLVGPWCFLDHYGPLAFGTGKPMDIAPHPPHIGLQTVTGLIEGEAPRRLHGLQLWVALPETRRHGPPAFDHYAELPIAGMGAVHATVLMGALAGVRSPAAAYSTMVGAEIVARAGGRVDIPLDRTLEHALMVIEGDAALGDAALGDRTLEPATLYYLGTGRDALRLTARAGSRLVLLGGEPFGEHVRMWWNFVACTPEEIPQARDDWEQGARRFGSVPAYVGARIPVPPLSLRVQRPA